MKKNIFAAFLLATSLVGCNGNYQDWANPKTNSQPTIVTFGDGSIQEVDVIEFANIPEDQDSVQVCVITAPSVSADAFVHEYKITYLDKTYSLSASGKVLKSEFEEEVINKFTKRPRVDEFDAKVEMWASNDTTTVKCVCKSSEFKIKAKPDAPEIADKYFLTSSLNGWNYGDTSYPLSQSGWDVYEDPNFSITLTKDEVGNGLEFKLTPGDALGTDEKCVTLGKDGTILFNNEGSNFKLVPEEGANSYKVSFNLLEGTWNVEGISFVSWLYLPGNSQGWDPATAPALKHEGEGYYTGYAYLDGGFKLSKARDWDHGDYGQESFTTASENFEVGGSGDIKCNKAGMYYIQADLKNKVFTATLIEYMGVTGGFCGWNEGVEMTWNATELCYEADAAVTSDGWKFRANGKTDSTWAINLGGAVDDLVQGGDNLSVSGSKVKLYPCRTTSEKIYCTVE